LKKRFGKFCAVLVCAIAIFSSTSLCPIVSSAHAADYPTKPVTLLITFEAGGTTDVATRLFVKYWQEKFPQNINVLNIPGAGGNVGIAEAKKQNPDGYYLVVQSGPFAMNHALGSANFTWEEFEPVSLIFESYMALCVQNSSSIKTFEDFAAEVKKRPGEFKYGLYAGSPMTSTVLALQDFLATKFHVVDIPQSKSTELLAGRIEAYSDAFAQMKPLIDSGDFRCLGVFANDRISEYPDIPTMKEKGVDYIITEQKYGIWAPKGTPADILEFLNASIKDTYQNPEYAKDLTKMGFTPIFTTRQEYTDWLKNIYESFGTYVKELLK
jgi:tripartite-type tricarboxylate transporter receptor subunit TctC